MIKFHTLHPFLCGINTKCKSGFDAQPYKSFPVTFRNTATVSNHFVVFKYKRRRMCAANSEAGEEIASALSVGVYKFINLNALTNSNKSINMSTDCEKQQPQRSALVQIILGIIANFSSLAPSMSLGFSAIALPSLLSSENPNKLDDSQASWVASIASVATPIGCFISGPISDKFGRRSALLWINVVCFLGWVIIALAYYLPGHQYSILLVGRMVTGLSTGLASMPAAVYMAEVSSPNLRGMFTTWNATSFSLGVLIVYALGWFMQDNWGLIAATSATFPCLALILVLVYLSESPTWLISHNRIEEAKTNMCKIFGAKDYNSAVQEEIETLLSNSEKSKMNDHNVNPSSSQFVKKFKQLTRPSCLKPFVLILTYFFFQQFSGVFVIVFYAVDIVREVKVTMDPYLAICLIAATRMVAAIIVGFLSKRFGRRPLSLVSGAGMTLCMISLAGYLVFVDEGRLTQEAVSSMGWFPITLLMTYFFASTLGFLTMPFAMAAEVFPAKIRGLATGTITCFAYLFNFVIVKIYPTMMKEMGNYKVFFFYGAVALLGTVFIALFLPETKGKTLQEIEEYFGKKKTRYQTEEDEAREAIALKASAA